MKGFKLLTFGFVLTVAMFFACKQDPKAIMDATTYEQIGRFCPASSDRKDWIVYYFDGDCSMCIAKVKYIQNKVADSLGLKPVFIAQTLNPEILKFNLSTAGINSCVYIDKNNNFIKKLYSGQVLRVNSNRNYEIIELDQ
jgi:hypothetical protein